MKIEQKDIKRLERDILTQVLSGNSASELVVEYQELKLEYREQTICQKFNRYIYLDAMPKVPYTKKMTKKECLKRNMLWAQLRKEEGVAI